MAFQPLTPQSSGSSNSGGFQPLSSRGYSNNPGYVAPKQVASPRTSTPPSFIQNIWNKAVSFFANAPEVKPTDVSTLISPVPKSQMLPQAVNRPLAKAAQFVGDTAAGIINTPSEAARSGVDLYKNNKTNTWQQNAGDIGALIQLPLLFLGGGAATKTVAGAFSKDAIANIAKQFGKNVAIGGAFGLTGGLQSGKQITNTSDYLKNLISNVTTGAEFGAVAGLIPHALSAGATAIKEGTTHIAIPLAKGASTKVGSLFIKNPSTNPSIEHIQLDPKVAQSTIVGSDKLSATPLGKAVMKASVDAQNTSQQVAVTVAKDGQYTLSDGTKVNVGTVPEYKPVDTPIQTKETPVTDLPTIQKNLQAEGNHPELVDIAKILTKNIGSAIAQFKVEGKAASAFKTAHNPTSDISFSRFKGAIQELSDTYGGHYREINDMIKTGKIGEKEYGTYQTSSQAESHSQAEGTNNQNSQATPTEGNQPETARTENGVTAQNSPQSEGNTRSNESSNEHVGNGTDSNSKSNGESTGRTTNSEATKPSGGSESKLVEQKVSVPRENLPIGQGKEKLSRLQDRVSKALAEASPELKDKLGKVTYNQMNRDDTIKAASEYVTRNPEEALRVLTGEIDAPKGLNSNSIFVAMANADLGSDLGLKLASLKSTAMGQNINILKELNPYSPVKILSDLYKISESKIAKKYGVKSVDKVINNMVDKGKTNIKPPSIKDWNTIIKKVRC